MKRGLSQLNPSALSRDWPPAPYQRGCSSRWGIPPLYKKYAQKAGGGGGLTQFVPQLGIYSPPVSDCNNRTGCLVVAGQARLSGRGGGVTPLAQVVPLSTACDRRPCPALAQVVPVSSLNPVSASSRRTEQMFYFRPELLRLVRQIAKPLDKSETPANALFRHVELLTTHLATCTLPAALRSS